MFLNILVLWLNIDDEKKEIVLWLLPATFFFKWSQTAQSQLGDDLILMYLCNCRFINIFHIGSSMSPFSNTSGRLRFCSMSIEKFDPTSPSCLPSPLFLCSGLMCKVSAGNDVACLTTNHLAALAKLEPRLVPLVLAFRYWARVRLRRTLTPQLEEETI